MEVPDDGCTHKENTGRVWEDEPKSLDLKWAKHKKSAALELLRGGIILIENNQTSEPNKTFEPILTIFITHSAQFSWGTN